MRRHSGLKEFLQIVFIIVLTMGLFSFPDTFANRLRSGLLISIKPLIKGSSLFASSATKQTVPAESYHALQVENLRLKKELTSALETLVHQRELLNQAIPDKGKAALQSFLRGHEEDTARLLTGLQSFTPADVVFRDPSNWSSTLWVNVGEDENARQGALVIGKNSPVVIGTSLVGVVEYVGDSHSRIRLITDAGLNPAVRVARGQYQDHTLLAEIESLQEKLVTRRDLFPDPQVLEGVFKDLNLIKGHLQASTQTTYLAKGFAYGSSEPIWRSRRTLLKGEGFNYDFPDKYGPARDLITGQLVDEEKEEPLKLVQEGDLLVTSGLDGMFPTGLKVGHVTHLYPLSEGSPSYELEISPEIPDFYEISKVYILPPYAEEGFTSSR
jgi:hypothetical protein